MLLLLLLISGYYYYYYYYDSHFHFLSFYLFRSGSLLTNTTP